MTQLSTDRDEKLKLTEVEKWLYAAVDTESKLLVEMDMFSCHGTESRVAFFCRLIEKYEISEAEFLVDSISVCLRSPQIERSIQLPHARLKVASDALDADQLFSLILAKQSRQRRTLA